MARLDNLYERALQALVTRASGRAVTAIAVLLYVGGGLGLPIALHWSTLFLVAANVSGTLLAASVSLGWLAVQIQAANRRHLVEWTTDLRRLDAAEFEWLVGELFHREGWEVTETGRQDGPDGNVDLRLKKGGQRSIVQCKRWTSRLVGVEEVRAFAGTLMREGLDGNGGIFVTLSDFTEQARREAQASGVILVDNRDLLARVETAQRKEPCPTCGAAMILDRSQRGWWFRCVAPDCSGKRDLGSDPGRAVDLLTQQPST